MKLKIIIGLLFLTGNLFTQVRPWVKQKANITTPWYDQVSPENVWPEYPRPQMEREKWINLNGIWKLKQDTEGKLTMPVDFSSYREILVPFPVESALSGVKLSKQYHVWYNRTFIIPQEWTGKRVKINFDAVDWESEVFINGTSVGIHRGGYDAFSYDITNQLKPIGQENDIVVRVYDPSDLGGQPNGKQWASPFSVFYTACTGIWQTVWLEPVSDIHVSDLTIIPDIDNNQVKLTVHTENASAATKVTVNVKDGDYIVATKTINANTEALVNIPNQKLWSPDNPFLYNLEICIFENEAEKDKLNSYFGMRKISMGEWGGYKRIMLNNKYVFNFGVLDQGYWPEGIYTAPCDEALIWDIEKTKEMGFNTSRKHGKTEHRRWYYHCDRLGLLVWQDIPSAPTGRDGATIPNGSKDEWDHSDDSRVSEKNKANFKQELSNIVTSFKNHPSIIQWIVFNENWGQFSTVENTQTVLDMDPNRLVTAASGFTHFPIGHIEDYHSYPYPTLAPWYKGMPTTDYPTTQQIRVVGEYGGIEFNPPGHTWYNNPQGVYDRPAHSVKQLTMRFTNIAEWANSLAKTEGLSGAIYTQIIDVENETNGLITYDRKMNKVDIERVRNVIDYTIKSCNAIDRFTTIFTPVSDWKYTTTKPADNWNEESFSDTNWTTASGSFGDSGGKVFTDLRRTWWSTPDIWLRKTFNPSELSQEELMNVFAELYVDGEVKVFINGVEALAYEEENWPLEKKHFYTLTKESKKAIRPDEDNVIAVHCHNGAGGCYIGLGLSVNKNLIIEESTSLNEIKNTNLVFDVYPNPTHCAINISFGEPLQKDEILEFYSLTGSYFGNMKVAKGTSAASFSKDEFKLIPGAYIMKINSDSKKLLILN